MCRWRPDDGARSCTLSWSSSRSRGGGRQRRSVRAPRDRAPATLLRPPRAVGRQFLAPAAPSDVDRAANRGHRSSPSAIHCITLHSISLQDIISSLQKPSLPRIARPLERAAPCVTQSPPRRLPLIIAPRHHPTTAPLSLSCSRGSRRNDMARTDGTHSPLSGKLPRAAREARAQIVPGRAARQRAVLRGAAAVRRSQTRRASAAAVTRAGDAGTHSVCVVNGPLPPPCLRGEGRP